MESTNTLESQFPLKCDSACSHDMPVEHDDDHDISPSGSDIFDDFEEMLLAQLRNEELLISESESHHSPSPPPFSPILIEPNEQNYHFTFEETESQRYQSNSVVCYDINQAINDIPQSEPTVPPDDQICNMGADIFSASVQLQTSIGDNIDKDVKP